MKYFLLKRAVGLCLLHCTAAVFSFSQALLSDSSTPLCQKSAGLLVQEFIGSNLNAGKSSAFGKGFSDKNIVVDGSFAIDRDFTFKNCEIMLLPGSSIVLEKGAGPLQPRLLKLDHARLSASTCDQMWAGILLHDYSRIETSNDTWIEDAETAITAAGCAQLSLSYTTFNRNRTGIALNPMADCLPQITRLQGVHFSCTSDLNNPVVSGQFSYAGIVTQNVPIVATSSVGAVNVTFSNLHFGILDRSAGEVPLTIIGRGFRFRHILEDGISVIRGNLDLLDCDFTDCEARGIDVQTIHRMTVRNARFRYDEMLPAPANTTERIGIFVENFALGAQMQVTKTGFISNNSKENNKITGIWLDGKSVGAGTDVQIDKCSFDFMGQRFYGININGFFPPQSRVRINGNAFVMEALGNSVETNAINCVNGEKNNIQIFSNNPFDGKTGGGRAYCGIYLAGSSGAGNFVRDNTFPTDYSYVGDYWNDNMGNAIFATDFENTDYCGNETGDCAVHFRMAGNDLGSQIYGNTMRGGSKTLLVDGHIGTQGYLEPESTGPHVASGNQWLRKFAFLSATAWAACAADCDLQPVIVHTQPTVVDAETPSFYPNVKVSPAGWFRYNEASIPKACGLTEFSGGNGSFDRIYRSLADGTNLNTTPARQWQMERHLYKKIQEQPAFAARHAGFDRFLSEKSGSSVERFYEVTKKMEEACEPDNNLLIELGQYDDEYARLNAELTALEEPLASDRSTATQPDFVAQHAALLHQFAGLDQKVMQVQREYEKSMAVKLRDAGQMNRAIKTAGQFEENEKVVNEIRLQRLLRQNDALMATQSATLRSIAAQCPAEGGLAVYWARGLLPVEEQGNYTDEKSGCRTEPLLVETEEQDIPVNADVKIFPNPADDYVMLSVPEAGKAQFRLYSSTGRLMLDQIVAGQESRILLNAIPSGVYAYQVILADGSSKSDKLVVQR